MNIVKCWFIALSIIGFELCSKDASAAENGQTHANLGYLDFLAGFEPPPGFYFRNDAIYVPSGALNDRNGSPVHSAPNERYFCGSSICISRRSALISRA